MSRLINKNILVTGATGLIASHLVEALVKIKGVHIVCLVREKDPRSYFYHKDLDEKVVCVYGDLNDKERVANIVTKYEINYIFHLGAQAIVPTAFINPYETISTNVMGTTHVLEASRMSPHIEGVIIASTDKAYGKNCTNATEDYPMAGDHPYDASKSSADLISLAYHKTYGLPVAVSRFGNVYGPGDLNMNRIVPGIMKALITNTKLELRSDGSFIRDYVYVKDVVQGYVDLAEKIDKSSGEAFNFGSELNVSVLELIKKVELALDKKVRYSIKNNQKNEIPVQHLSTKKVQSILGWQGSYDFETSIKETYSWYVDYFAKKK